MNSTCNFECDKNSVKQAVFHVSVLELGSGFINTVLITKSMKTSNINDSEEFPRIREG